MTELSSNKVAISSRVIFQEVGGEAVLLDLKGERYYRLDVVATRIWQLIEKYGDLQPVLQTMCGEFAVDETVLRQDLSNFINDLAGAGLISLP